MSGIQENNIKFESLYNELKTTWEKELKEYGVELPNLYKNKISKIYTKDALVLLYLYKNMKKIVSKKELTDFLEEMRISFTRCTAS